MLRTINHQKLELVVGDIADQKVDAIVNAANMALAGGGGVDGAIHSRGGPQIMEQTDSCYPEGCPTGSAVISTAGNLRAKYVIHAVGPVWRDGTQHEPELLAATYTHSLELAVEHQCSSIALPAISTGTFGYPIDLAADVSLNTVIDFLNQYGRPELVRFVLFSEEDYRQFARCLMKTEVDSR